MAKTVRELLNKAHSLYDNGEWNKSLEILENQETISRASPQEAGEMGVLTGFNYWKKGERENAFYLWRNVVDEESEGWTKIAAASAHAGLGMYYAEKGEKEKALEHARLAQDLLPEDATLNQVMNLNACGITLANIGELERAEEVLRRVAKTNEQLEKSGDSAVAQKAMHQRGKNGYNRVSLVLIPQKRWDMALYELLKEVIPRYEEVGAETDLAAAHHRVSEIWINMGNLDAALNAEEDSRLLWKRHEDDVPGRVKMSEQNIVQIRKLMRERE